MNKKTGILAAILFAGITAGAYAEFGIGVQFSGGYAGGSLGGPSLLISPNERLHFIIDWYIGDDTIVAFGADIWALDISLTQLGPGNLSLFVGPGPYGRVGLYKNGDFSMAAGVRVPVGVHWRVQGFDPFVLIAPALDIKFIPSFNLNDWIGFSAAAGVRFWF
ncbi:MAG: hypothetical protein LBC53_02815 [Spirochaetaceae bacterium]|jgi:hypothetical protein|nr:hypothetical protein [Spirochaetaceae bacterium]